VVYRSYAFSALGEGGTEYLVGEERWV